MTDEIEDTREPGWWWADNEIIDVYGPQIGVYGIAVYACLARHANTKRIAWPSFATIAREIGASRRKVIEAINTLQRLGLVKVQTRASRHGDADSNKYVLLSLKSKEGGAPHAPPGAQSAPQVVHHVHQGGAPHAPKEDTKKKTQGKKSARASEPPSEPPPDTADTRRDLMFERLAWIVGVDWHTCGERKRGQLNSALGTLRKAGYTAEHLSEWWRAVWLKDFRWTEKSSRPTIQQVLDEIGKLGLTVNGAGPPQDDGSVFIPGAGRVKRGAA